MQTLSSQHYRQLIDYLPHIKSAPADWQLVDLRLLIDPTTDFDVHKAAAIVEHMFEETDGRIYICNAQEIFMLIHWEKHKSPKTLAQSIEKALPAGSCELNVREPTPEGLRVLELKIQLAQPQQPFVPEPALSFAEEKSPAEKRAGRRERIVLVADDDMYMRMLVKKGLSGRATVHEVADGHAAVRAYKELMPDILLLDFHMPGREGPAVLREILAFDPEAYVIMLSADSSRENVGTTVKTLGAKGFIAKPFTKETLLSFVGKCPRFH